jgi:hypothetical protein
MPPKEMAKGDKVDILVASQFPLAGAIGEIFPDNENVQVIVDSPRGRWSLLVPDSWLSKTLETWKVQIP